MINVQMKLADPDEVSDLISGAILECSGAVGVSEIVRQIHLRLSQAGCVILQVDNDATPMASPAVTQ